jgi:hypothetical protein
MPSLLRIVQIQPGATLRVTKSSEYTIINRGLIDHNGPKYTIIGCH